MNNNNIDVKKLQRKLDMKENEITLLKNSINKKNNALYIIASTLDFYLSSEDLPHSDYFNELFNICHFAIKEQDMLHHYSCYDDIVIGKALIENKKL